MKTVLLIFAVVLLLRLPFLNQAVQGDDVYHIAQAEHAQIDPLHPENVHYLFNGRDVDFRGYTHPPLNAWYLAALLAAFGKVREIPFHVAYISFSLIAAFAMWVLAHRFSPHPFWATLSFLATPAFVVNGNSFEADIPFLAFWMAGIAAFITGTDRRSNKLLFLAAVFLATASLAAMQVVLALPILATYLFLRNRTSKIAWIVLLAPVLAIAAWQFFEYFSTGQFPAAVAAGYQRSYGYQRLAMKIRNAEALCVHFLFLVFPLLLPSAFWKAWKSRDRDTLFLAAWIVIFFGGAVLLFFAGSARYLLPLVAPLAILVSRLRPVYLAYGFAAQLAISVALATVNYQHWDAYRQFARGLASETQKRRVWVNAEWGLRFYMEQVGARPTPKDQQIPPGDMVVESELAYPVPFRHGGSVLVPVAKQEIRPRIPFRLIGISTRSGYSTAEKGLLPFGLSNGLIDRLRADVLQARMPTREDLPMNAPDANDQILSGIYSLEQNQWRWTAQQGSLLLKAPDVPMPVHISFYIPDPAPARQITLTLDGVTVLQKTAEKPGSYQWDSAPQQPKSPTTVLGIAVDKTFSSPEDDRQLGVILTEAGFRK